MKKISLILCVVLGFALLTGCGKTANSEKMLDGSLEEIMNKVYEGIPEDSLPMVGNQPITAEMSEYNVGVAADRYKEAQSGDALIGSIPHSVVLVRAKSMDDVAELKADIEKNANPRKWVCVEAEKVIVDSIGDVIILIMSDAATADAIDANFKALAK